jgi:hypothetical protein
MEGTTLEQERLFSFFILRRKTKEYGQTKKQTKQKPNTLKI